MTIMESAIMAAREDIGQPVTESERLEASRTFRAALESGATTREEWLELRRRATLDLEPTYCLACPRKDCVHRECYRRLPRSVGGLGLCPNLKARGDNNA